MRRYFVSNFGNDCNSGLSENDPICSLARLNSVMMPGDCALLHSGEVFYGQIIPPSLDKCDVPRTYYGSYGGDKKPTVSGYKKARSGAWRQIGDRLWSIDLTCKSNYEGNMMTDGQNVGFIRVSGKIFGNKFVSADALTEPWDFYCDGGFLTVLAERDPSELSDEIMIAANGSLMYFGNNIVIDGIIFRGTGGHGLNASVRSAHVKNCEFHELGGSELPEYPVPNTRYGNGIECWANSSDVLIENCRFSNIYDVAFTMQGNGVTTGWDDIVFRNNVIWDCQQAFEVWSEGNEVGTGFHRCIYENNVSINMGYCWGYESRRDKSVAAHLLMYRLSCPDNDITVRGNTFTGSRVYPICKLGGFSEIPADYRMFGNTFIIVPGQELCENRGDDAYLEFRRKIESENSIEISYGYGR